MYIQSRTVNYFLNAELPCIGFEPAPHTLYLHVHVHVHDEAKKYMYEYVKANAHIQSRKVNYFLSAWLLWTGFEPAPPEFQSGALPTKPCCVPDVYLTCKHTFNAFFADILRKFDDMIEVILPQLPTSFDSIVDPEGKAALIWILGEYGEVVYIQTYTHVIYICTYIFTCTHVHFMHIAAPISIVIA